MFWDWLWVSGVIGLLLVFVVLGIVVLHCSGEYDGPHKDAND